MQKERELDILLVEDNPEIVEVIELHIPQHFRLHKAFDGEKAMELFDSGKIDIVILDLMLPKINGYDVLKHIRGKSDVPILILSAKNLDYEIIVGLNKGADDYLTKPFNPMELIARINALARRIGMSNNKVSEQIERGDLILDLKSCALTKAGEHIELTGQEFKLLKLFMEEPDRIFTKRNLIDLIWGDEFYDENVVAVYISRLREKIEENPKKPIYITTFRGLGYKFNENK